MRFSLAFKVLFYKMLHDLGLKEEVPPWYSLVSGCTTIPEYACFGRTWRSEIRVDTPVVKNKSKHKLIALEMSCPWVINRKRKSEAKSPVFGELEQHNIIIDTLRGGGGWDEHYNTLKSRDQKPRGAVRHNH